MIVNMKKCNYKIVKEKEANQELKNGNNNSE